MTGPISGAGGNAHLHQAAATPPALPTDPDHDGDIDGAGGDKATKGSDPLSMGRVIDASA
jgi:hypothetical protein